MEEENKNENIEETKEIEEQEEQNELDDEEFTYTVDNNNINNDYNKNSEKTSYIYILVGLLVLIIIIVTLVVVVNKKEKKVSGYPGVEAKLVSAAKKYYEKYPEQLPKTDDNAISIEAEKLIQNSFLKPFSEMVDKDVQCTGYVKIYKNDDIYSYFPFLNCGQEYKSTKLSDKIIEENLAQTGESGLYKENNEYIFRGEYVNNYVKFDNETWRILKINDDRSIKMMLIAKKPEKKVWDDRYNVERNSDSGKNDFAVSRILEELEKAYKENTYVSNENKELLIKKDWCIGKIPDTGTTMANLNACSTLYPNLYIGLITVEESLKPSLEENCKNIFDGACTNYNYLSTINVGWTINAGSEKTYTVFSNNQGAVSVKNASTSMIIRPVVNINADVLYKEGNGTETKPYIIQK